MLLPGNRTGGVSGDTGLGNRLGVAKEDQSRARGRKTRHDGPWTRRLGSAPPPHFIAFCLARSVVAGRRLDVVAVIGRYPGNTGAEISGRRSQRASELDDSSQSGLASGTLEQRDLGAVEIAAVAQLFLRDTGGGAGTAEVGGKALLGDHRHDSLRLTTRTLQTECSPLYVWAASSATVLFGMCISYLDNYAEDVER